MTRARPPARLVILSVSFAAAASAFLPTPLPLHAQEAGDARAPGHLTLETASGELGEGRPYEYERGVLLVPQNRDRPDGPVFELEFHRFPALPEADPATPPIIHLNGGPGWPGFGPELSRASWMEGNVLPRVRVADFVVVGQRGIGSSGPNTACERPEARDVSEPYDPGAALDAARAAAARCRAKWEEAGVDLAGISVVEAAGDVREVVDALGYERVQIHGGSFGSHWAMAVMRYHPEIVERAVLSGLEGPDHTYDMPGWILAALERVAADAEASGVFEGRIPPGGLLVGLRDVIARAEEAPISVGLPQRRGRDTLRFGIGAPEVRALADGYSDPGDGHRMRAWPADMIRLYEGDFEEAARAVIRSRASGGFPTAAFFMFDCGSGISGARLRTLLEDPGAEVVGPLGAWYQATCAAWGADLGEGFRSGFDTDIPTLMVHGDWDLSTPLENALELRPRFARHHFVLVERGTHGALGEALRADPGFREAFWRFVATGETGALPDTVTLPEPDWMPPPPLEEP